MAKRNFTPPRRARPLQTQRIVPKRPRISPVWSEPHAMEHAAQLHDTSSPCAVAERVACRILSQRVIDYERNQDLSERELRAISDCLWQGERILEGRLALIREAHRRALLMGAYVLEERGWRVRERRAAERVAFVKPR
jgi:hypothetical protein